MFLSHFSDFLQMKLLLFYQSNLETLMSLKCMKTSFSNQTSNWKEFFQSYQKTQKIAVFQKCQFNNNKFKTLVLNKNCRKLMNYFKLSNELTIAVVKKILIRSHLNFLFQCSMNYLFLYVCCGASNNRLNTDKKNNQSNIRYCKRTFNRSSRLKVFCKKAFLKHFLKFT